MGKKVERLKLKPEVKKKWLKALRSGEYKQAVGRLCNEGAFCCLGVLCDIKDKERVKAGLPSDWKGYSEKGYETSNTTAVPPVNVLTWATTNYNREGSSRLFRFREPHERTTDLSVLNDFRGKSFAQIADVIEEQF